MSTRSKTNHNSQPRLADLKRLARQAGAILRAGYEKEHQISYKGAIDLVTEIDHESEAFIIRRIKHNFPEHFILAEESGSVNEHSQDACWYVDPLDGTVNYAHGIPIFCVSIAYARKRIVRLAVVYDPLRDEMFSAESGRGAFLNNRTIHVAQETELQRSLLVTGFPYNAWTSPLNNLDFFTRFVKLSQGVRRLGSAALDMCYVAAGRFSGYWELTLNPWDVAASGLIAREAGAVVTDLEGNADYLSPPCSVLAASSNLHLQMLEILKE